MIAPVAQQWEGPEPHGLGPSPIVCCPSAHPCCAGDARGSGSRAGAVSIGGVHAAPRPLPESVTDALHACSTRSAREALHPLRRATPVTSRYTRYVALHPLRRAAPVASRYTRSERVHCLRIGCIAYGSGAPHNAGTHHRRLCRPHTYHPQAGTHETTKPQAPPATTEHGLTGNTSQPTGPAHKPHPTHNEAATGFPATASSRSIGATQRSATDQAVMSTWSSTAARPASRRATGTRNGEQDT